MVQWAVGTAPVHGIIPLFQLKAVNVSFAHEHRWADGIFHPWDVPFFKQAAQFLFSALALLLQVVPKLVEWVPKLVSVGAMGHTLPNK